jgi:hypothetical protein
MRRRPRNAERVTLGTAGTSFITAALDGWIEYVVLQSPLW